MILFTSSVINVVHWLLGNKMDIKLTMEEFNHISSSKGICECDICKKFKQLLNKWIEDNAI